jgi:hypothetical protein
MLMCDLNAEIILAKPSLKKRFSEEDILKLKGTVILAKDIQQFAKEIKAKRTHEVGHSKRCEVTAPVKAQRPRTQRKCR